MPTEGPKEKKVKDAVLRYYGEVAKKGKSCCQTGTAPNEVIKIYSEEELKSVPEDLKSVNCGCGNPVALAQLKPGQVVLDLGSGAGLDAFLAAKRVGPSGKVIGVDATDEMLARAAKAARELGFDNVEFRKGVIEDLPIESNSVDVIISNCVINLVPDKDRVFREAYRVLKPGGKLSLSDRVLIGELPEKAREDLDLWSVCVSGAVAEEDYVSNIRAAGFVDVQVTDQATYTKEEARSIVKSASREGGKGKKRIDEDTAVRAFLAVANDRIVAFKPLPS